MSRQAIAIGCVLLIGTLLVWREAGRSRARGVEAGFWFEEIAYSSRSLDGPITPQDLEQIAGVAWAELRRAFAGLELKLTGNRDARYRVRVVQKLRDLRFRREVSVAGESRAITGLGGRGAVGFDFMASAAIAYAPAEAGREAIVAAIGRGIGRAAVHEFTHQFLPTAPIHDSDEVTSYEYASAARPEQYYGEARWDLAWPLLQKRFAPRAAIR